VKKVVFYLLLTKKSSATARH